jgi:hypothetical protein
MKEIIFLPQAEQEMNEAALLKSATLPERRDANILDGLGSEV